MDRSVIQALRTLNDPRFVFTGFPNDLEAPEVACPKPSATPFLFLPVAGTPYYIDVWTGTFPTLGAT